MDRKRSSFTSSKAVEKSRVQKSKKAKGDCLEAASSSHTKFYAKKEHAEEFERITRDEYFGRNESISGSTETFQCIHGPDGKQYSEKALLKRNFLKELDPIPKDRAWNDKCPPALGREMVKMLEFLVQDPVIDQQMERFEDHLRDFSRATCDGYFIESLSSLCVILDYLVENVSKKKNLREGLVLLLRNMEKPILLSVASDVVKYFETLQQYIGFMGYLLIQLEEDSDFDIVSRALIWQLSAPDGVRGKGAAQTRHVLASATYLLETVVRMLALSTSHRYPTFLQIALFLACDSADNCLEMMKGNIVENIFSRFNPYFPDRPLPEYDINPLDPQDMNVKLGDSTKNLSTTMSLLLVLSKSMLTYLENNPKVRLLLPCPGDYAQRCFLWAFRYECRAREHKHERITLTVIANALFRFYRDKLTVFSNSLMLDVMALAVSTEVPRRHDWTDGVTFNTLHLDVQFKKSLIAFSVDFIKCFSYSHYAVESQYWLLGLMYLIDPGLSSLKKKWSPALFAELRKITLQALVCTIPVLPARFVREYGLVRRIMWYIEWYSEVPYELPILYWCVRVLQVSVRKDPSSRHGSVHALFESHGIIILMHLCYTLLHQKTPPVERVQCVIAVCLELLTFAIQVKTRVSCCVYPDIKWPISTVKIATKMLNDILYALDKNLIINDKWLISLVNFIWEAIVWKKDYRGHFISQNGVYKLLDLITLTTPPVQCITLAVICDIARSGEAIGQLVTWRAGLAASSASPVLVNRGSNIAGLLAAVFRHDCKSIKVSLDEYGVLQDLDYPILSTHLRKILKDGQSRCTSPDYSYVAADLAGSRLSKAYALLQMLSEDLSLKVSLADETYKLYKNIQLSLEDETILVLCSHFLTIKLNESWFEINLDNKKYLPHDEDSFQEFLQLCKGWVKEIKILQERIIASYTKKDMEHENSLYAFLGRVRLNIALDALREVRCVARSSDRSQLVHAMLHDAVQAHHRRSQATLRLDTTILRTYGPALDDQNITGHYVKVYSIFPKNKLMPRDKISSV